MATRLGSDCKLYRMSAGTYGSPTWAEIEIVRDLAIPTKIDEADASSRAMAVEAMEPTLLGLGLDFDIIQDVGHADYEAIRDAYTGNTSIVLFACTGAYGTTGETYCKFEACITKFEEGQQLGNVNTVAVSARPIYGTNAPAYGTV